MVGDMAHKTIAIDFDGCLCENKWPDIGEPNMPVFERAKQEQANGAKLILWTCRENKRLEDAVEWCAKHGLIFDAVNANTPENNELYGNDCRKIGADEYWDDKAVPVAFGIEGVGKDTPTIVNANGGKQSDSPYASAYFPPKAFLTVAKVVKHGRDKYGADPLGHENWRSLSRMENLDHALTHIMCYLAGDTQDDHLAHAATRIMFALETK
jgi:hypothetical protein